MKEGTIPANSTYLKFPQRLVWWKRFESVLPMIRKGDSVLDFGCGNGSFLPVLSMMFNTVYAIDILEPQVKAAESTCSRFGIKNVNIYHVAQGEELKSFGDETFDCITTLDVFEHVPLGQVSPIVTEFSRVLKPDGQLILSMPTENYLYKLAQKITGTKPEDARYDAHYDEVVRRFEEFFVVEEGKNIWTLFKVLSLAKR